MQSKSEQELKDWLRVNGLRDDYPTVYKKVKYLKAYGFVDWDFKNPNTIANKRKEKFRAVWIGIISLLVTVIGIANAMLMSVTERFREIGTMKCLGALSSFVTQMFVLEASLMGLVGGIVGALAGALFAIAIYTFTYGASLVFGSLPLLSVLTFAGFSIVAGVVLSVIAALYPARVAAAMVPATALRSTI